MIITSTTLPAQENFKFDLAYLYLWKIVNPEILIPFIPNYRENLDLIKFGFAYFTRVFNKELCDGVIVRIAETLEDMEKAFNLPTGILQAEIISLSLSTVDEIFSEEQFIHQNPKNACFRVWNKKEFTGHSEFYQMTTKTAKAKFANCQRATNKNIGYTKLFTLKGERKRNFRDADTYYNQQINYI